MNLRKLDIRRQIGTLGMASFALLAAALAFSIGVVQPLEAKSRALAERVARLPAGTAPAGDSAEQLNAFYDYLGRAEQTTDWLARLYAIGEATGVELRSASYRSEQAGRIERYRIVLPVTGRYAQMRDFLGRALTEIPMLSLDQISLKRETPRDDGVHAELHLTLHMVKP